MYLDQGPGVRTELAKSVRKDRGLNILQFEKRTRLINNLLYVPGKIDQAEKVSGTWVSSWTRQVAKFGKW